MTKMKANQAAGLPLNLQLKQASEAADMLLDTKFVFGCYKAGQDNSCNLGHVSV